MKFAVLSDIHLYTKTDRLSSALGMLGSSDALLIAGDLADSAQEAQYRLLHGCIRKRNSSLAVYCVSGNHDNPARDDTAYRDFEAQINSTAAYAVDECGAFCAILNDCTDIIGLNPVYHKKQFFFPDKGRQIAFLEEKLSCAEDRLHIVMCHPPLIAHNPQRSAGMAPYMSPEQDARLQNVIDRSKNVIFISGHTHVTPDVEWVEDYATLYINNGSICPTSLIGRNGETQQGNITFLDTDGKNVRVTVKGIHTGKKLLSYSFCMKK